MNRAVVLQRLGAPSENRLRYCDGLIVEQMIFERPGETDVSIFLVDGRVAAKKVGKSFPLDLLSFALPLMPAEDESGEIADRSKKRLVAVGMKESELRAQFREPKLRVPYTFKRHSAEHAPIGRTSDRRDSDAPPRRAAVQTECPRNSRSAASGSSARDRPTVVPSSCRTARDRGATSVEAAPHQTSGCQTRCSVGKGDIQLGEDCHYGRMRTGHLAFRNFCASRTRLACRLVH
jgi:hypothetical protein